MPYDLMPRINRGAFVAKERVERRLAAVLAADVAGYPRLMGADEVGTLAALRPIGARAHNCCIPRTHPKRG